MRKRAEKSISPIQRQMRDQRIKQLYVSTASMLNRAF